MLLQAIYWISWYLLYQGSGTALKTCLFNSGSWKVNTIPRCRSFSSRVCLSAEPLDPLDFIKSRRGSAVSASNNQPNNSTTTNDLNSVHDSLGVASFPTKSPKIFLSPRDKILLISSLIESKEAEILSTLPYDIFLAYASVAYQYTLRFALIALVIFAMLFLPLLHASKQVFNMDFSNLVALSPIVLAVPYIALYWWQSGRSQFFFDQRLKALLYREIKAGSDLLEKEEPIMMEKLMNLHIDESNISDEVDELISLLATYKLYWKLDAEILFEEIISVKNRLNKANKRQLSTAANSKVLEEARIKDVRKDIDRLNQKDSISRTVELILEEAAATGESKSVIIEKLKALQQDLNKIADQK